MNKYQKRKLEIYEEQLKINKEILEVQRDCLKVQLEHLKLNQELLKNKPQYVPIYVEKTPTTQPSWTYCEVKGDNNE